jgi:hypothetical protein
MKKPILIILFLFATSFALFAQDYKVQSIEYLPDVLKAQLDQRTERPNSGQKCAVLQIVTKNISVADRSTFDFTPDLGSFIPEKRIEKSQWVLWVSPGITYLTIDSNLGTLDIYFPDYLPGEIESLKTYRITIVGTKQAPPTPEASNSNKGYGSCKIVFVPTPLDAVIYLNGDSIVGSGSRTVATHPGVNSWAMEHPLYHPAEGTVELTRGKTDTLHINLDPAYGYIKILEGNDLDENEELSVYLDGVEKGKVPYESEKLAQGLYEVTLKADDTIKSSSQIEVKEHLVSINRADELCRNYKRTQDYIESHGLEADSSFKAKRIRTRFYPITGKVTINSIPQSTIIIDSVDYGITPVTVDNLSVGTHRVELSAEAHTTLVQEINVEEEKETSYLLRLKHSCFATIITDKEGDKVYVDDEFVGETPITIERPYGVYSVLVLRPGQTTEGKEISLSADDLTPTFDFSFGQTVNIETAGKKARLYLDNEYIGRTPQALYILNGQHRIRAERGWGVGEKDIIISKDSPIDNIDIETHIQSPTSFLSNGAFFLTGNLGYLNKGGETVYGLNIGDIANGGQVGWYLSIMTNTNFLSQLYNNDYSVLNAHTSVNQNGEVAYGQQPSYTGERTLIRASALFGVALNVAGPVYLRIGAGYGLRRNAWKTTDDSWVTIDPISWKDFEGSLGLQFCIYNFIFNSDVLIPVQDVLTNNKKLVEFRVGLGFCLKHKR